MQNQLSQISSTLHILLARFNGQILVPLAVGAACIGMPIQTARNKLCRGEFPIPTVRQGRGRYIHIHEIASYIDSLRGEGSRKRGPRTKASKLQAREIEGGAQ